MAGPIALGFVGIIALIGCIVAAIMIVDELRYWRARREIEAARQEIERSLDDLHKSMDKATAPRPVEKEDRYVPPQY